MDRGSGVALWRQIADAIRRDIFAGDRQTGERLPAESDLAQRFGVNRHTVRRALATLENDGLVRADRGRGTFVAARPVDYPITERTRFSAIVEAQAREPSGRLIGSGSDRADMEIAEKLNIAVGAPLIRLEILHVVDGVPISILHAWFPQDRFGNLVADYAETGSITKALARHGVQDYRRLETRLSALSADPEAASRLAVAPGHALLINESVNVDADDRPIQFSRSRTVGDRVSIVIRN